jgi:hypothetical protein
VDISPGIEVRDVDLTLSRGDTVRITGKIAQSFTEGAGPATTIYLLPSDQSELAAVARRTVTVRDGQGTFQIDAVRPGAYILMADRFDGDVRYVSVEHVGVGRTDVEVDLVMAEAARVNGRIRLEPEGAAIKFEGVTVELQTSDPSPLRVLSGKVNEDGTFTIEHTPPGKAIVGVRHAPKGFYVRSVRYGGVESTDLSVQIANGATMPVELTLSAASGRISGSVLDSKQRPAGEAFILLVPDEEHRGHIHLYGKAKADAKGSFEMSGIAPGRYAIFAMQEAEQAPYFDSAFLKRLEPSFSSVTVTANQTQSVQLRVAVIE